MKIVNPAYVKPHEADHDAVLAVIKSDASRPSLTFDDVRKALGRDAKSLPDGVIHQICTDAGLSVAR